MSYRHDEATFAVNNVDRIGLIQSATATASNDLSAFDARDGKPNLPFED